MSLNELKITITAIVLSLSLPSVAQEVATQFAFGGGDFLDTYLSPEKYKGMEVRFVSEVLRDSGKRPMSYSLTHEGTIALAHNRAHTAKELSGGYDFTYGAMYRTTMFGKRLSVRVGAMAHYNIGFTYNMRNSANNPAQGYMSLELGPQVMLGYGFTLWGQAMRLNWQARMPLVGIMFSPNYGQSYYEIFNQGDYDHNVVVTSIAVPQLRHQLSLDILLSKKYSLRVGYLGDYRQCKPNNLRQHHYYNAGTIGIVVKK